MERVFERTGYVLRVMRDGGIFAGEFLAIGSSGGMIVVSEKAYAEEYESFQSADEARRSSADPGRLIVIPL